ncbi:HXXEE domain-containing protein [Rhizorhabdus phycosphaerae]|uniref:HXXEE domain-containing protein n=1 Tax=Rhizorhabdus phycosphaerae TaxID=2711156 RepID=UPI0013EBECB1|nr:HXXEE domain-containing protein [Rhizorhabdus phycosphaerae]
MALSYYRLTALLPPAFVLHVAEEYFTGFPGYAAQISGHAMDLPLFLGSNLAFLAILVLLQRRVVTLRTSTANAWLIGWSAAHQFWNFVFHLVLTLAFDRYSPGMATGTLIYLPLSLLLWRAALSEDVVRPAAMAGAILTGGIFMGAIAAFGIFHVAGF